MRLSVAEAKTAGSCGAAWGAASAGAAKLLPPKELGVSRLLGLKPAAQQTRLQGRLNISHAMGRQAGPKADRGAARQKFLTIVLSKMHIRLAVRAHEALSSTCKETMCHLKGIKGVTTSGMLLCRGTLTCSFQLQYPEIYKFTPKPTFPGVRL